jgi:hypothetical protein
MSQAGPLEGRKLIKARRYKIAPANAALLLVIPVDMRRKRRGVSTKRISRA